MATHVDFLNQTTVLLHGKHPHSAIKRVGGRGRSVNADLTESVTLNSLKRVSQVEILGKSLPGRLASKYKGPEERLRVRRTPKEANVTEGR